RPHRQVGVALPRPELRVRQLSVLLPFGVFLPQGQRAQRFREQGQALHAQRDLAGLGAEQRPLHTDHIPQIEQLHDLVRVRPQVVHLEVELDLPGPVLEMSEGGLAHGTEQDEPSGEAVDRLVAIPERLEGLRNHARPIEPVGERDHAALGELGEFLASGRFDEARHAALLPKRFRYASMNGSRSPSITFWTSPTLSSVRWSLTIVYGWNT